MSASALVGALWVPARKEPDHRAEMVTQWLCGEALEVLERHGTGHGGWVRCRGGDAYVAWAPDGALIVPDEPAADRAPAAAVERVDNWEETAAWSLGAPIRGPGAERGYLPWGARVQLCGDGSVELPTGKVVRPSHADRIVSLEERSRRFPPTGEAVVGTARGWAGVPYVWGGRTDTGADCSGFVQAVFAIHGVALPRDSERQPEAGVSLSGLGEPLPRLESGNLVFFAPEGEGITHVAISTGETGIIHSSSSNGAVAEDDLASNGKLERMLRRSVVCSTRPFLE